MQQPSTHSRESPISLRHNTSPAGRARLKGPPVGVARGGWDRWWDGSDGGLHGGPEACCPRCVGRDVRPVVPEVTRLGSAQPRDCGMTPQLLSTAESAPPTFLRTLICTGLVTKLGPVTVELARLKVLVEVLALITSSCGTRAIEGWLLDSWTRLLVQRQ